MTPREELIEAALAQYQDGYLRTHPERAERIVDVLLARRDLLLEALAEMSARNWEPADFWKASAQDWRERAERWEALARQLGDAVEAATHEWSQPIADQVLAALSVYRDAIKEDG